MKKILINFLPHNQQRYETVGDYEEKENDLQINISEMRRWEYEAMVLIHELIEYFLTKKRKISIKQIDSFDKKMEKNKKKHGHYVHLKFGKVVDCLIDRESKPVINNDEPGVCPEAPYFREHEFATKIEKKLCREFKIKWQKYNEYVNSL